MTSIEPPSPPAAGYPAAPTAPTPERLRAGATRELTIAAGDARVTALQALRGLGFHTTREQYSLIEAERGSKVRGLTMTRTRVPVALRLDITPDSTGSLVQITVEDRWPVPSTRRSTVAVYADVFTEVLTGIDAGLTRADPAAAKNFGPWWRNLDEGAIAASRSRADGLARTERAVAKGTSRLLDGPRTGPTSALADAHLAGVMVRAPSSAAHLSAETVDGMLTVGQLVASRPGAMPAKLVAEVEATVLLFEQHLAAIGSQRPEGLTIDLAAAQVPVITFLVQQAALREQLPVRLLMRCTTCRLEKVVNPDLAKLRERNRRTKVLTSSVGAVFGGHSVSPFILVGRLAQVKKSEPDFVCTRCQGTDADQRPITFCSRCGERLDGSVLRACPKCELDLRTLVRGLSIWTELPPVPAPASQSEPTTAEASTPVAQTPPTLPEPPTVVAAAQPPQSATAPAPPGGWGGSTTPQLPTPLPPSGWYPDPWRQADQRYWDGQAWTPHVSNRTSPSPT